MSKYRFPHGSSFKYIRAVPRSVRPLLAGRKYWVKYLPDASPSGAAAECAKLAREHDALVAGLAALTDEQRTDIVSAGGLDEYAANVQVAETLRPFLSLGAEMMGHVEVDDVREQADIDALVRSSQRATAKHDAVVGMLASLSSVSRRQRRKLVDLIDVWATRVGASDERIGKMRNWVAELQEITGDIDPRAVTVVHARQYRDSLQDGRYRRKTASHRLDGITSLFRVNKSATEGLLELNVFEGVRLEKGGKFKSGADKRGFTPGELKTIFKALKSEPEWFRLATMLTLYHGARPGEMIALSCDDVVTRDGMWCMQIGRIVDGRVIGAKNRQSVRTVPIHSALVKAVMKARGKRTEEKLFHASAAVYARRFTTFLRERCKISDPGVTRHSLRHTHATACRDVLMPQAVADALHGHALPGSAHAADYGEGPALKVLKQWNEKVRF